MIDRVGAHPIAALALLMCSGCGGAAPVASPEQAHGGDTAGGVEPVVPERPCPEPPDQLRGEGAVGPLTAKCEAGELEACERACGQDDADGCAAYAHVMQKTDREQAVQLYFRACELGSANGCTNYGATIRLGFDGEVTPGEHECALDLFDRACKVDDIWACGMLGQAFARGEGVEPNPKFAESVLVGACDRIGYFACSMLAQLYDDGYLEPPDPEAAARARARACETGYEPACPAK
ncbi:MAG: hypothetical protein OXT09_00790 [Myxococcales bacterium]|nr:hypothetical protein [Myxococcales bacterium]